MSVIVRVLARGDGVTGDGQAAPYGAPGDTIHADGSLFPGPHHTPPACPHFPTCGGCRLQHLDDTSYADFVRDRIIDALAAHGLAAELAPVHLSPPRTRRRASLKAERRGNRVAIGFNEARSHAVVDMHDCAILHRGLFALVAPLRALLATMLTARAVGEVRMTLADQGVDLTLKGIRADDLAAAEALSGFAAEHALARLSIDDGYGAQTRWEPDPVTITLGGAPVPLPPDAFLQATADGETALVAEVRRIVGDAGATADLFAGLGTIALALPSKVYAAEAARDVALALKAGAARVQRAVFVEHRDLYRRPLTTAELNRFEAVVLDPPRAGAREQVAAIAEAHVPRVAYVSCNPASFARDAAVMVAGGYRLERVTPVGQFRWSTHVELVGAFAR